MNRNKNNAAKTPPMGWNSWDCYGASVTEEILLGNAEYMAKHLKAFGWEYIVCDIQWYEPEADSHCYHNFYPLCMDEYSRLIPAVKRFPSAKDGNGFRLIADKVHELGLKFGIHIMRGIPRQAVHAATPIKGSTMTARDIAQGFSVCSWNTDMYGINAETEGAQEYYNSLFELYASWEVDFVKVDDICITEFKPNDLYSARREIELIHHAIDQCGREMVLSLSPGPAMPQEAAHLSEHANMWRITGDFWDNWDQLYAMFERCKTWSPYVKEGCWPDCDMLPLGRIEIDTPDHNFERYTNFTQNEQLTMMTLWCMFRSPLMIGSELRDLDDFTLGILTNKEVLCLLENSHGAHQIMKTEDTIVWESYGNDEKVYVAFFNTSFSATRPGVSFTQLGIYGNYQVKELWSQKEIDVQANRIEAEVGIHGAVLYQLSLKK